MPTYRALIEAGPLGSGFGVVFPDFPGCVSAGDTLEETMANAGEALSFHIRGMIEDGEPIPMATALGAPLPDWLHGTHLHREVLVMPHSA